MSVWSTIGTAIVSYLLGILTGYFWCNTFGKKLKMNGGIDYRNFVIIVISLGWIASVLVEIVNPTFHANIALHGLMGAIVGYFFKQKEQK